MISGFILLTEPWLTMVARVVLPDGRELVRAGVAWHYVKYSRDSELSEIQAVAREACGEIRFPSRLRCFDALSASNRCGGIGGVSGR